MILIVEDGPEMAGIFAKALNRAGFAVEIAATGADALKALLTNTYSFALVDLALPDMNGADMAVRARSLGCDTPMVAISGAMGLVEPARIASAGFVKALEKPLFMSELIFIARQFETGGAAAPT